MTIKQDYPHYFKRVPPQTTHIDVYRVIQLFNVTDPCLQHALKKILVAGGRGVKDQYKDVTEAIVSLTRWQDMRSEEQAVVQPAAMPFPGNPAAQTAPVKMDLPGYPSAFRSDHSTNFPAVQPAPPPFRGNPATFTNGVADREVSLYQKDAADALASRRTSSNQRDENQP